MADLTSIIMCFRIKNRWQRDTTRACLENIQMFTKNYELIILESMAGEHTPHLNKLVREEDTYLTFENNLSVTASHNLGVSKAKGKYIVFLANDIMVHQDWLNELIRHYRPSSPVKILGPNPNRSNPENYEDFKKKFKIKKVLEWPRVALGGLHGGVFMEKKTFETIGPFDEGMKFFFTDRDYDQRIVNKGYHCCIIPKSLVTHLASMTWFYTPEEDAKDPNSIYDLDADVAYFQKKWGRNP